MYLALSIISLGFSNTVVIIGGGGGGGGGGAGAGAGAGGGGGGGGGVQGRMSRMLGGGMVIGRRRAAYEVFP